MISLLFFILFSQVNAFLITHKYNLLMKTKINLSPEYYHIEPNSIIMTFNINNEHKYNLQNEINDKINDRFIIHTNNIYVSLHDYTKDNLTKVTNTFQIFLYVHDILNNSTGRYILESKDYFKITSKSIICSFYDSTKNYQINFGCQFNYDNINYSDYDFDFIYDNGKYFKNINTNNQKVHFTPRFIYSSIFRYKDIYWKKSNNIIYYKIQFTFSNTLENNNSLVK